MLSSETDSDNGGEGRPLPEGSVQPGQDCYALAAPMADIFLSYAREDRASAERIAQTLAGRGNVWWDPDLPAGPNYTQVIEQALTSAKCVLVLWSAASVVSTWVQDEAREAQERGVLVARRIPLS
jgi:TIR domain